MVTSVIAPSAPTVAVALAPEPSPLMLTLTSGSVKALLA